MNIRTICCLKYELNGRGMSEMIGLNPKHYAFKNQHMEKQKYFIKPIEDRKITSTYLQIEAQQDFIQTLEDTSINCTTYTNTETTNT